MGLVTAGALRAGIAAGGPENDHFANRKDVGSGMRVSFEGSNVGASAEVFEQYLGQNHQLAVMTSSIWWQWTAPVDGTFEINTYGSMPAAWVRVFQGKQIDALSIVVDTAIVSDRWVGRKTPIRESFTAISGTTYLIQADTNDQEDGTIKVNLLRFGEQSRAARNCG